MASNARGAETIHQNVSSCTGGQSSGESNRKRASVSSGIEEDLVGNLM